MLRSRAFHRKETKNLKPREEPAAASDCFNAPCVPGSNQYIEPCEKFSEALAPDDSQEHDSGIWHVMDDWPKAVSITSDEVEVIEAFLRKALDDLLK